MPGVWRMATGCYGGSGSDETYTSGNERDAQPASGRDNFMQTEVANESDEDIGEGGGGKHVGEVGPGKRGHVTGKECEQEEDARGDPGMDDGEQQSGEVVEGDIADFFHAASQQGIAGGAEDGDSGEDEVFSKGHGVVNKWSRSIANSNA